MKTLGQFTAIALCACAALALAISQAFVIHDTVALQHGTGVVQPWPVWATWSMALGFELAIASGVLAAALTGYERRLVLADAGLIAMSVAVAAGYAGALVLVPLQYAAVIVAAHRLHGHYQGGRNATHGAPVQAAPVAIATRAGRTPARKPAAAPVQAAGDWRARVQAGEIDHVATKAEAAQVLGVHPSTLGRAFERNGHGWHERGV